MYRKIGSWKYFCGPEFVSLRSYSGHPLSVRRGIDIIHCPRPVTWSLDLYQALREERSNLQEEVIPRKAVPPITDTSCAPSTRQHLGIFHLRQRSLGTMASQSLRDTTNL